MTSSKKKVLLTLLCAVLLVAVSVAGTMAYLTDTETINNTFTVGNVTITLDEAKVNTAGEPVDNDGEAVTLEEAPRVPGNEYKLMPGHEYTKDPTIHVASTSEECWLFVRVEDGIATIEAAPSIANQMASDWTAVETGVYAYKGTVTGGRDIIVFSNFKIADSVGSLADYANATIQVTAYAVQKEPFTSAAEAWAATFGSQDDAESDNDTDNE